MKFTLIELEFRNFLSYGNKDTVVKFGAAGVVSITGDNGNGKSVFEDALSMVLYGKPYRKIKIKEIRNWDNPKADTRLRVSFKKNEDTYRITRIYKKSTSDIKIESKTGRKWKELDLVSTVKLIQDEIDKLIGINHDTFKNIVAIASSTTESKPFLAMAAADKRGQIETLLRLESISNMSKLLKQHKSDLKMKSTMTANTLDLNRTNLEHLQDQYKSMAATKTNFDAKKKQSILDIETKLIDVVIRYMNLKDMTDTLITTINVDDVTLCKKKISSLDKDNSDLTLKIGSCDALINHAKKTIKTLESSDTCPVCSTDITPEHSAKELSNLNEIIESQTIEKKNLSEKINSNTSEKKSIQDVIDHVNKKLHEITIAQNEIARLKKEIDTTQSIIDDKRSETLDDLDITGVEKRIETLSKDIRGSLDNANEYSQRQKVIDITEFLLSDKGIKTDFYNVVVPLFNTTVNDYLKKFGLNIAVIFDSEFNYTIQTMKHSDVNYFSFSQGQRSRIDISIILTFIKLSKTIANWDCNLLLLDEVIDQNLDTNGLQLVLESIKSISAEEDLTAMVISHKLSDINFIFDREIAVTMESGFSVMTEL